MQERVTVLCRLNTVSIDTSILAQLFKDYGLPLEVLGVDLLNVFKNPTTGHLYYQAIFVDIMEMCRDTASDVTFEEYIDELNMFVSEIAYHLSYVNVDNSKLINIQFHGKVTLVLEFLRL